MKKIFFLLSILAFSGSCSAFDGASVGTSQMEMLLKQQFQIDSFIDNRVELDNRENVVVFPRRVNKIQENKLKLFMRSCDDCLDVPIVGGGGGGRNPLPVTKVRDLCESYPFLEGC